MIIRPARPDDIDALIAFRMRLVDSYGIGISSSQHPDFPAQIRSRLQDLLGRDTHHLVVAEDAGQLLGCICGALELSLPGPTWTGICGLLTDMWVEEEARGRGAAGALVADVCRWVQDNGGEKTRLHSTPMAVPVYEKLGFHEAVVGAVEGDVFTTMWLDFPQS